MTRLEDQGYFSIEFHSETDFSEAELKNKLEKGSENDKVFAMKQVIAQLSSTSNPYAYDSLLMWIIRFILPSKNKTLKKLLLLYWELLPKLDKSGNMKQEMILHPNEYIRGITLRFLAKLYQPELLEPCVPAIKSCLEHRHPYVRKNAVLAVMQIFKHCQFLIPDAPELIRGYISNETDLNAKRNALVMLINSNQQLAVEYLKSVAGQIPTFDPFFQVTVVELIRLDCKTNVVDRPKYMQLLFDLLQSTSNTVRLEAANTILSISSHSNAIKAAAQTYVQLIAKEADVNAKVVLLSRLSALQAQSLNARVFEELVMDILRLLSCNDLSIRKNVLQMVLDSVSTKNVQEIVTYLKKELLRETTDDDKSAEYKQLIIKALNTLCMSHPDVTSAVLFTLIEFLGSKTSASIDVVDFIKRVMAKFPELRQDVVSRAVKVIPSVRGSRVYRGMLWVLGMYVTQRETIEEVFEAVRCVLGPVPITDDRQPTQSDDSKEKTTATTTTVTKVLPDGTYGTESIVTQAEHARHASEEMPPLRALILKGDFFVASVLTSTLTKLILKYPKTDVAKLNKLKAETMLIITSILRLGKTLAIDEDSNERIRTCLRILSMKEDPKVVEAVLEEHSYRPMLPTKEGGDLVRKKKKGVEVDSLINFRYFKKSDKGDAADFDLASLAVPVSAQTQKRLDSIIQLSGYSDPIYCEAYMNLTEYEVSLDILVVNQTSSVLQNVTFDFNVSGEVKPDRSSPFTLSAHGFYTLNVNMKVKSMDNLVFFGSVSYEAGTEMGFLYLKDITVDVAQYLKPELIEDLDFRKLWTEFEWENKIAVKSDLSCDVYFDSLMKKTNMSCLNSVMEGDILVSNLYAKSIFGEDVLMNLVIETDHVKGGVSGHARIRARLQGVALCVGEKVSSV